MVLPKRKKKKVIIKEEKNVTTCQKVRPVPVSGGSPILSDELRGPVTIGVYTRLERNAKIQRYREKQQRELPHGVAKNKRILYPIRKIFSDRRPRLRGRFVKLDEESKIYLALTKPGSDASIHESLIVPPAIAEWWNHLWQMQMSRTIVNIDNNIVAPTITLPVSSSSATTADNNNVAPAISLPMSSQDDNINDADNNMNMITITDQTSDDMIAFIKQELLLIK